ncbi:MAG: hypothetical protein QOF30_3646 [Acidimicrobiaceae bacterium]|jgi:hypothetical protein|nr:hypothetical protein [Acidimicrobiaceae bacterium]
MASGFRRPDDAGDAYPAGPLAEQQPGSLGDPAADGRSGRCLVGSVGTVRSVSRAEVSPETERAGLCEFLDMQREALIANLQGLSEENARRAATASSLSLLSLIKHSAILERRWFQVIVAGRSFPGEWPEVQSEELDPTFRLADDDTIETVVAYYREQVSASQEIVSSLDLDTPCAWPEMAHRNLRWVALHMIEETARHAGHADIIRETIDGSRGL